LVTISQSQNKLENYSINIGLDGRLGLAYFCIYYFAMKTMETKNSNVKKIEIKFSITYITYLLA